MEHPELAFYIDLADKWGCSVDEMLSRISSTELTLRITRAKMIAAQQQT